MHIGALKPIYWFTILLKSMPGMRIQSAILLETNKIKNQQKSLLAIRLFGICGRSIQVRLDRAWQRLASLFHCERPKWSQRWLHARNRFQLAGSRATRVAAETRLVLDNFQVLFVCHWSPFEMSGLLVCRFSVCHVNTVFSSYPQMTNHVSVSGQDESNRFQLIAIEVLRLCSHESRRPAED